MLAFFSLAFNNAYGQIQLSVGEKYQCFLEDYANRYYDWVNISWSVDNGLYEDFSGSYVRTVSFHEYKSGTYKVTVNWTETDLSDPYDPFRHKSHTWYFTCKNDIIPVTKITLNYSILVLTNSPAQLTATVYPSNATNKNISWESSNPSVATVSSNGLVTPVSAGDATITCRAVDGSGVKATCGITVLPILVENIELNASSASLKVGETKQLTATITPSNATNKTVTWTSSNPSIATVDSYGKVTAKAKGSATITCKANDSSGKQANCAVTVTDPIIEPTAITISPSSKTITVGEEFYASYTLTPSNATTTVTWSSDDTSIATVTQTGLVKGIKAGYTYINVETANGKTDWFKITVKDEMVDPTSISVSRSSLSMKAADTYQLTYSYGYPSGTTSSQKATPSVTWTSSSTSVATVASDGTVTAKAVGTAKITVKSANNLTASCNVTVIEQPVLPKWAIKQVAAGGYQHTMILKTDGTLWACGYNYRGQLGDGTTTDRTTPKQVMSGVTSVSAGDSHTMILKTDGTLWACGGNSYGQLGDGTNTDRTTPKQVMSGVTSVSAGDYQHTMILKTDGTLWACGNNYHGQLGDGTTTTRSTPKQVMSGVASVSAGGDHTMILKTDGTLWACGYNYRGQIGDGTTTDRTTPKQVMSGVASVSAGYQHTMILKTDGTLWACGYNYRGQLGDGTNVNRYNPVQLSESDNSINEKGDVNEDGYVNGTDLVALTNIILGKNPEKPSADVNGDGYVNGTDYVALANIILGKSNARRMTDIGEGQEAGNSVLNFEPFVISVGETKDLTICLSNPDDALTLLQFDLQLPKGLTIAKVGDDYLADMSERTNWSSHQLSVYGNDHHSRFLLASSSNDLIEGTEGAVILLTVTADADFNGGAIALYDILGVSPDEQEVNMPDCQFSLIGGATGIFSINGNQNTAEIYSLSGQRQNTMKKGINIIGGKKVIKK